MRKSTIIKAELDESFEQSNAKGLAADEKAFIDAEIKELRQELSEALEAESKTKAKPEKEPKAPKEKKPVVKKTKMTIVYKGKEVTEDDPEFCTKITDAWRERKEASKKSAGKRKTKPVIQRVAANIASAVVKGITSIEIDDIKKDPKAAIKKMEKLEAAGKDFLDAYKDILGDKITQKEIAEEFSGLDAAIKKISEKYLDKKKMSNGGGVGKEYPIFKKRDGQDWKEVSYIYASSFDEAKKIFAQNMTKDNGEKSNNIVWLSPNDEDTKYKIEEEGWYDMEDISRKTGQPNIFVSKAAIDEGFDGWSEDVYSWELREPEEEDDDNEYAKGGGVGSDKSYEVYIDEGDSGTRTLADFNNEKEAKNFMYEYNLKHPNAKLGIDTVTSDYFR